jgi:prepilin-type N-terminal cleavage/methylation domain-containing protein
MNSAAKRGKRTAGFTLIESLVALLVLTIVMVGVFSAINKTQGYYRIEGQKVDFAQQGREFIDQFTRDLHQAGFPSANSVGPINAGLGFAAQGLIAFTPTSLTMDGDLDGQGKQTVTYDYNAACTCLRRAVGGFPASAAVQNVIPPGPAGIFTAYDVAGNAMPVPIATLNSVRSISITFSVQGGLDANNRTPIQITMTGKARLPNND